VVRRQARTDPAPARPRTGPRAGPVRTRRDAPYRLPYRGTGLRTGPGSGDPRVSDAPGEAY